MSIKARVVKKSGFEVKIYQINRSDGRLVYQVRFFVSGQLKQKQFSEEKKALRYAKQTLDKLTNGRDQAALLSNQDALIYELARKSIAGTGYRLDQAAQLFSKLYHLTEGNLIEAAEVYKRDYLNLQLKTVPEVVNEYLESIQHRSKAHKNTSQHHLNNLASHFPTYIHSVTVKEIEGWIERDGSSERTFANRRQTVIALFKRAKDWGYLPEEKKTAAEKTKKYSYRTQQEIEVFTPQEMALLLKNCPPELLTNLVLGGFGGVRTEEVKRLSWNDIDLNAGENGIITLAKAKTKTRQRRLLEIQPVLRKWLLLCKEYSMGAEKVSIHKQPEKALSERVAGLAGFKWKRNGLRHSYASYRYALILDEHRVTSELGNSPNVFYSNYRELVKKKEAIKWFNLFPEKVGIAM